MARHKYIVAKTHGAAYFKNRGGLAYSPLLANGNIERGIEAMVDEAPKSERKDHMRIMKQLGFKNVRKAMGSIAYY